MSIINDFSDEEDVGAWEDLDNWEFNGDKWDSGEDTTIDTKNLDEDMAMEDAGLDLEDVMDIDYL
ncbi:hypothetical protein P154DRAFT_571722 [Amniculicola lignicola CBS 123094]|uniref:Uncharacterized protein n=1 Tax=Amniculicola lignicola CBS 123094 TaxID=1392246 RepID=A0A6A5WTR6_9PLEO|nr:hypothetical protein P154DRAFT_571722 [Amniculicola lignicola CBS 123094]